MIIISYKKKAMALVLRIITSSPSHATLSLQQHFSLPSLSTHEYLFICLPFWKENSSFLIFRHGRDKQVVPLELHHTLKAQSTALRSVFFAPMGTN